MHGVSDSYPHTRMNHYICIQFAGHFHKHMFTCIHMYFCTDAHTHIYTCIHIHQHIYTSKHTYFHIHKHIYTCIHLCLCTDVQCRGHPPPHTAQCFRPTQTHTCAFFSFTVRVSAISEYFEQIF